MTTKAVNGVGPGTGKGARQEATERAIALSKQEERWKAIAWRLADEAEKVLDLPDVEWMIAVENPDALDRLYAAIEEARNED